MKTKTAILMLLAVAFMASCKSEKKLEHYSEIYNERPSVIYVAPLNDLSLRHALRTTEDSLLNLSLNIASKQLFLTASDPLVYNGYYVPGPLASAQIAATEWRTGKQLRKFLIKGNVVINARENGFRQLADGIHHVEIIHIVR